MLHVCYLASTEAFIQLHMTSGLPGNRQWSPHIPEASEAMLHLSVSHSTLDSSFRAEFTVSFRPVEAKTSFMFSTAQTKKCEGHTNEGSFLPEQACGPL